MESSVDLGDVGVLRAVDNEDDDDDEAFPNSYSQTVICWSDEAKQEIRSNGRLSCSLFLISTDPASSAFIDVFIKNKEANVLGTVYSGFDDLNSIPFKIKSKTEKISHIYRLLNTPDILICQCKNKIQPEQSFSWVEKVFSSIDCVNYKISVMVLSSALTCDYKSNVPLSNITVPFLRVLYTDTNNQSSICPTLSEPNIISSLPAQILTFSQCNGVNASLYVCYTDVINLDIATIKAFLPVLSLPSLKHIQKNPEVEIELKKLIKNTPDNSLLYL